MCTDHLRQKHFTTHLSVLRQMEEDLSMSRKFKEVQVSSKNNRSCDLPTTGLFPRVAHQPGWKCHNTSENIQLGLDWTSGSKLKLCCELSSDVNIEALMTSRSELSMWWRYCMKLETLTGSFSCSSQASPQCKGKDFIISIPFKIKCYWE